MIKLFTHNDFDGVACSILAQFIFDEVDITYCETPNIASEKIKKFLDNDKIKKYDKVFITDISVNKGIGKLIEETAKEKVMLLDHHKTALWLNRYDWAYVEQFISGPNDKSCGAYLFYEYLYYDMGLPINKVSVCQFVEAVRQYDTWEWKTQYNNENPNKWQLLFKVLGKDKFSTMIVNQLLQNDFRLNNLNDTQNLLLELEEEKIKKQIEKKNKKIITKKIQGYQAGVIFIEEHISQIGNEIHKLNPNLDFIALINLKYNSISFRTFKENVDVSKIAKSLGGGGHSKSAGASFSDSIPKVIIDKIFE